MDRKKIIYIGSLLIITAIISIASFSYAIWSRTDEQHGKINIVAGTLNYELLSSDLNNNSITVPAGTNKTLEIEIKSLNTIDSKYELYYTTTNNGISIGYSVDTVDEPTGTIAANSSNKVTVIIKNRTNSSGTITFGCQGGFSNKELILAQGDSLEEIAVCDLNTGYTFEFPFDPDGDGNGQIQTFNTPCDGYYKLETWGAQGGGDTTYIGGYGGYSTGIIDLNEHDNINVVVGQAGSWSTVDYTTLPATYNGGGGATAAWSKGNVTEWHGSGGGATHMAKSTGTLATIGYDSFVTQNNGYLVAAGGGGGGYFRYDSTQWVQMQGGHGGGYEGVIGSSTASSLHAGYINKSNVPANQSHASTLYYASDPSVSGSFGQGGSSYSGGGGGLYGGSGIHGRTSGGSSYIGNPELINKSMYCYNCTEDLTNTNTFTVRTNGTSTYRDTVNCPNGYSSDPISKCAKAGNGYAKITYLGEGNITTLYSAAVDEVYYYDSNNTKQIIGTTDATGKLENVFVYPGMTLYSSVAKDPSNLSNSYSKTLNNIDSETYLMPDGDVVYWYGWKHPDIQVTQVTWNTNYANMDFTYGTSASYIRYYTDDITGKTLLKCVSGQGRLVTFAAINNGGTGSSTTVNYPVGFIAHTTYNGDPYFLDTLDISGRTGKYFYHLGNSGEGSVNINYQWIRALWAE